MTLTSRLRIEWGCSGGSKWSIPTNNSLNRWVLVRNISSHRPLTMLSFTGHILRTLPSTSSRFLTRTLSTSPRLLNPLNYSQNPSLPFSFLPANSLTSKNDRKTGLTEIRGPYYAPVTKTYLDELLSDWGEYVDGIKFAGGAFSLMPEERLKELIEVCHKHSKSPSVPVLFVSDTLLWLICRLLCLYRGLRGTSSLLLWWLTGGCFKVLDGVQEYGV